MTILSVAQEVSKTIGLAVPTAVLSSTDREHVELVSIAAEMAERIVSGYDWQYLSKIHTITGNGTTIAFPMPTDYARMLVKSSVWSSSLETPLSPITDLDKWLELDVKTYDFVVNAWAIYGGEMNIRPALAAGVTAKFFYQSNLIVRDEDGSFKPGFTSDNDVFRVDERLLKLGTIWRWKEAKGQPYAEWMTDFEEAKERLIVKDRGSKMIRVGRIHYPSDISIAYPQSIIP